MFASWRPPVLAAAFIVTLAASASAQSVIVLHTAPGGTVEVAMNAEVVGTATAGQDGKATIALGAPLMGGRPMLNVRLYVDACGTTRRVVLVEPGAAAIAADACSRQDLQGVFRLLPASTFVIDVSAQPPVVRLRQGPAPAEWFLSDEELATRRSRPEATPLPGLMIFGGGSLLQTRDAVTIACGSVADCSGSTTRPAVMAGTSLWFSRFFALDVAYAKPLAVTSKGKSDYYSFENRFSTHVLLATAKVGWPLQRARPYVAGGLNYLWSSSVTDQTVNDTTVTVDGVTTTIAGGKQTFELKTRGLGWTAAAGLEIPVTRTWQLYTEVGGYPAKGKDIDDGEGRIDDRILYWTVGLKVRLGQ